MSYFTISTLLLLILSSGVFAAPMPRFKGLLSSKSIPLGVHTQGAGDIVADAIPADTITTLSIIPPITVTDPTTIPTTFPTTLPVTIPVTISATLPTIPTIAATLPTTISTIPPTISLSPFHIRAQRGFEDGPCETISFTATSNGCPDSNQAAIPTVTPTHAPTEDFSEDLLSASLFQDCVECKVSSPSSALLIRRKI